jgi:hypothetical protein
MNSTIAVNNKPTVMSYPMTTGGPHLCWRGNVTNTTQYPTAAFNAGPEGDAYNTPCSDVGTNYYLNPNMNTD